MPQTKITTRFVRSPTQCAMFGTLLQKQQRTTLKRQEINYDSCPYHRSMMMTYI